MSFATVEPRPRVIGVSALFLAALPVVVLAATGARAQEPVWNATAAREAVQPRDRQLVARIDHAWNSGIPKRVVQLFDDVHPQADTQLLRRVRAARGRRTSHVLGASQQGRCRCLFLETEFESGTHVRKLFEILVLVPGKKKTMAPRLLYATKPDFQSLVRVSRDGKEIHGLPFGAGARFACRACNYTIGSPQTGDWLVFAGSDETQSIEKVDVFHLDKDIAMELAVQMTPETPEPVPLAEIVADAAAKMAERMRVQPTRTQHGKLQVSGLESPYQAMDIKDPRTGHVRRFLFLAVRKAPSCYLLLFQGSPDLVSSDSKEVRELLATFRLLDPERSAAAGTSALLSVHTGGTLRGNTFAFDPLGLRLTGVEGWKPQIGVGKFRFQVIWNCPLTKSKLVVSGLDWHEADSKDALSSWLSAWLTRKAQVYASRGFECNREVTEKGIGGHAFRVLEYGFRPDGHTGRAMGRLAVRVHGDTLIVIETIAMPGSHQEVNLRLLEKRIETLELQ